MRHPAWIVRRYLRHYLFSPVRKSETKTGEAVYGSPQIDAQRETAAGTGKETATAAGISSGAIIPQSSAETPETPRNSAEKRHKEKESKENSPSIPRTIPPARDEEDKVSLSPDGNRGNVSAESCGKRPEHSEDYRLKLQRLGETCYNLGCSKGDVRKVLMIENIAMDDSPIWQLIEELKASGGRYSLHRRCVARPVGTGEDGTPADDGRTYG